MRGSRLYCRRVLISLMVAATALSVRGQAAGSHAPDTLILNDGNTLHGKFVEEVNGTVTFHTESLGDVQLSWDKIKEVHTTENFAVLDKTQKVRGKHATAKLPVGRLDATNATISVQPVNDQPAPQPIAVKNAQFIVDAGEMDRQLHQEPGFFTGWNGAATAGATLVSATQNSYAFSGSLGLVRVVPTVTWLDSRNRTSADFNESFGKITQPAYTTAAGPVAASVTKSSILHFDAERDQYFSPRFYALAQTSFDHNFSQDLDLQQIYGGGIGWTAIKRATQSADIKGTMQYERQTFISGTSSENQSLIGSTFAGSYMLKLKLVTFAQSVSFIPAWNNVRAYSTEETNTFTFPTYKNFGLTVGTMDSYLNDPPPTEPPTKRNSFQFTTGVTYAFKSKY